MSSDDLIKLSLRQSCHLNVVRFNNEVNDNIWTISGNFSGSIEFNGIA